MSKTKAAAQVAASATILSGNHEPASMIPAIRILFHGTCPKLSSRGGGELTYELGIDDDAGNSHLRIAANAGSGSFSNEWLGLSHIRTMLEIENEQRNTFTSTAMHTVFVKRSSNNRGYLAAILKAEGVLEACPGQPAMLRLGNWDSLTEKIASLQRQDVNLTDHIAIAAKEKAEKKALLMSKIRATKPTKPPGKSKSLKSEQEPGVKESLDD